MKKEGSGGQGGQPLEAGEHGVGMRPSEKTEPRGPSPLRNQADVQGQEEEGLVRKIL